LNLNVAIFETKGNGLLPRVLSDHVEFIFIFVLTSDPGKNLTNYSPFGRTFEGGELNAYCEMTKVKW
jgi:hypothetical protein